MNDRTRLTRLLAKTQDQLDYEIQHGYTATAQRTARRAARLTARLQELAQPRVWGQG